MRKVALVVLAVVCCLGFVGSVCAAALEKGEAVYVRSNLRPEGSKMVWQNMSAMKGRIPIGTEVKIKAITGGVTTFVTVDTNKTYYAYINSGQLDKLFVKSKSDIGLENMSPDKRAMVENSEVAVGMTKGEVFASKGCPAYIAWGKTSESKSFDEIMQSDKWYYMTNSRGHDVMVTFSNGVAIKTGGYEK